MDLISAFSNMQQASLASQIDVAVAGKILANDKMQGNAVLQLLQSASNVTNTAGDAMVAAATGLGGQLDVRG